MTQAHPVPDVHARGGLAVEDMTSRTVSLIGACEGTNQIQLRAGIDDPADAAKNAIHLSKCPESIDVNRLQARGLREKFLVAHESPGAFSVSSRWLFCVQNPTQCKENLAMRASQNVRPWGCAKLNTLHVRMHSGVSA
jgi:hypothetical protein